MSPFDKHLFIAVLSTYFVVAISVINARVAPTDSQQQAADENGSDVETRVIGGKKAKPGEYPYHVGISPISDETGQQTRFECSGAIIGPRWILTSGSCASGLSYNFVVVAGQVSQKDNKGTVYKVASMIPHPNYYRDYGRNDIGLIRTVRNITFNKNVQPIPFGINDDGREPMEDDLWGSTGGWGSKRVSKILPYCIIITTAYTKDENTRFYDQNLDTALRAHVQLSVLCGYVYSCA